MILPYVWLGASKKKERAKEKLRLIRIKNWEVAKIFRHTYPIKAQRKMKKKICVVNWLWAEFKLFRLLITRTKSKQDDIFSMIPSIDFWCEVSELCWHNSMSMLEPMLELKKLENKKLYISIINGILLPKLFWPTVRKIVLVIEKNFWNSRLKS